MIAVIGGGMAGCTAAYTLKRAGLEVTLYERADTVGGRTATVERDGFTLDTGAVYLLSLYERTFDVLREAGMGPALAKWRPTAGLHDGRRTHAVRYDRVTSFLSLDLLTIADKVRLLYAVARIMAGAAPAPYDIDSLAAFDDGQNMEAWSRRRLGDRGHDYVVRPLVEPLFGVGCERLAVPYLLGLLRQVLKVGFVAPAGGMQHMCDVLTAGVKVQTRTTVDRIERRARQTVIHADGQSQAVDGVIVATDAHSAADLLEDWIDPSTRAALRGVQYAAMKHVVIGYQRNPWPGLPLEMVLPVGPGDHSAVGIILHAKRTPAGVPAGGQLLSVYLNDRFSREASDGDAAERARRAVSDLLGSSPAPTFVEVFSHPKGLALSPPGHYLAMQAMRRGLPYGLQLAGDYLAHLGVETAVVTGQQAAVELAEAIGR